MRPARLAAVLLLPALALAQETGGPPEEGGAPLAAPTGSLLLASLPADADLVVQTPDLARFFASATDAGIGTPAAWREALRGQIARWCSGLGDEAGLVRGSERLLAMADGEAVVASMLLPKVGTSPRRRARLVAFRSSHRAGDLRAAVDELVRSGLRARWPDEVRNEKVWGRPVLALSGPFDELTLFVEDGLVVATDDALALRLLFRGLDTAKRSRTPATSPEGTTLEVRHDLPGAKWRGVVRSGVETVTVPPGAAALALSTQRPSPEDVMTLALGAPADLPLLPIRLPDDASVTSPGAGAFAVTLRGDGTFAITRPSGGEGAPPAVPGGAAHLGWLRAFSSGKFPLPLDTLDATTLAGLLAASERARKDAPAFHEWAGTGGPGEVRGPAWHGPTTMLMFRTLAHVSTGRAPGASPPATIPAPPKPGVVPLPPPTPPERR